MQVDLQPLVSLSAALASGKASGSKGSEEKKAAAAACQRVLYTLQSGGRRLWANLAPAVALDASQVLVEYVSEGVLHDVLNKQVGLRVEAYQRVLQQGIEFELHAVSSAPDHDIFWSELINGRRYYDQLHSRPSAVALRATVALRLSGRWGGGW